MTVPADIERARTDRAWCFYRNLVHTCYREARHLGKVGDKAAKLEVGNPDLQMAMAKIAKWRQQLEGRSIFDKVATKTSTTAIRQPWLDAVALDLRTLQKLFARPGWRDRCGGDRWASIVALTIRLGDALDSGNADAANRICDDIANVEHNTGRLVSRSVAEQQKLPTKWPQLCS